MEQSKMRTYLLYAVGEIALVMIGILLALQVNNWNEERSLKQELNTYLIKKLDNLREDHKELIALNEYRIKASELSTSVLDQELLKAPQNDVVELITMITVERRFISSLEKDETIGIYNYFKQTRMADLETEYFNLVEQVTFNEFRLNTFSEELESDIWRSGFFNVNRHLFTHLRGPDRISENTTPLIITDELGAVSLGAIIRRNELAGYRLSAEYTDLIKLNEQYASDIQNYLSSR